MSRVYQRPNSNKRIVEVDDFASTLEEIFGDLVDMSEEVLGDCLKAGAKTAAKEWRAGAKSLFNGDSYRKSIRWKYVEFRHAPYAVVYSTMPGLPHLLEKGHAKVGGGRVAGRVHIRPAADDGCDVAYDMAKEEMAKL